MKKRTRIQTLGEHPIPLATELRTTQMVLRSSKGICARRERLWSMSLKEINVIAHELDKLNLGLLDSMKEALISFIHSVGWEAFLYSELIDHLEASDYHAATEEINRWIFDSNHQVIGGLLDRRRQETKLFLRDVEGDAWTSEEIYVESVSQLLSCSTSSACTLES